MFPSLCYILFIIVFDSVKVHSHETTDKTHDVTKKHVSGVAPGNGSKLLLNIKRETEDFDEVGDRVLYGDISAYNGDNRRKDESQSSSEKDESISDNDDNDDSSEVDVITRALQTGDLVTPVDLLPITTKLLKKVSGGGKGIVSSSKSPEDLADKLFAAYFLTTRRIVYLTDKDLSGLDALQALALEGEVVKTRTSGDSITEKPFHNINLNGQLVQVDPNPMRCHYKLLFKKVSPPDTVLRKGQSGGITPFNKISKLEKKMSPNRHLIINHKGRKSNKENNEANEDEVKKDGEHKKYKLSKERKKKVKKLKSKQKLKHRQNKSSLARNKKLNRQRKQRKKNRKSKFTEIQKHLRNKNIDVNMPITTTQRPVCKWRYICKIPGDLDTCRLHTSCINDINNNPMLDKKYVDTGRRLNKKEEELILQFRKMCGLTVLDEEVEKIVEQHVLIVKPENMRPDYNIETLDEYFVNVLMAQHASTTPGTGSNEWNKSDTPHPLVAVVTDTTPQDLLSSREDLRRMGGEKVDKMKSAPTSNLRDPHNVHVVSESITTPRYNKK